MKFAQISIRKRASEEDGGVTPLALFMSVGMFMLAGIAIDVSNLVNSRTQLQVAADFAAHAALYTRELNTEAEAKAKALELVEATFPNVNFGEILDDDDIIFGSYDADTQTFTSNAGSKEAVFVRTDRMNAQDNAVASFLMQFVGFPEFDLVTPSVFETYRPWCLRDGWVAEDVVDSQSNNDFSQGFCIHSNEHVEVNNNNVFESGVTVTMPTLDDFVMPGNGFNQNPGLQDALGEEFINLRILNQLPVVLAGLYDNGSEHHRSYINNTNVVSMTGSSFATSDFQAGRIHEIDCSSGGSSSGGGNGNGNGNGNGGNGGGGGGGGSKVTIDASSSILTDVVVVTDCEIKFSNNSEIENSVIFTTNTDDKSITSSQGLRLGVDDACDPDGGVQIVTYGGFEVASKLEIYSSQVIARGPIQFAAQGNGVEGGSFISGETIDGTSNTQMSACPNGGEANFQVDLFRMAG